MTCSLPTFSRAGGFTKARLLAVVAVVAVLGALLVQIFSTRHPPAAQQSQLALCRENLRQIGAGLRDYAAQNGGALPLTPTVDGPHQQLVAALAPRYISDPRIFYCPAEARPEAGYNPQRLSDGVIGYFYYAAAGASTNDGLSQFLLTGVNWPRPLTAAGEAKSWVMSDAWYSGTPTAHTGYRKGVNYLMLDGSVDFVAESPRQAFH